MKRRIVLTLIAGTLLAVAVIPRAIALPPIDLAGGQMPQTSPASGVSASGAVEAEALTITAEVAGRVDSVLASEGDEVLARQGLVLLDASLLQTQLDEARGAVAAAQANLDAARDPVRSEEIDVARAAVQKALATTNGARQALVHAVDMRDRPLQLDTQIHQAQAQLEVAEKQVESSKAQLAQAEANRDRTQFASSDEEKTRHQAYVRQVEAGQAAMAAASAARDGARQQLADLLAIRDNPISLKVTVNTAQSHLDLAQQVQRVAEADLAILEAGPRAEDVAIAAAQLAAARANLDQLEVQRTKMVITAPISGLVAHRAIEPGEMASVGQALLKVADLDRVTLKVYVAETQIGRVKVGHPVDVYIDAFPGEPFSGRVSFIATQAEFTPKKVESPEERVNTVFAVKVKLSNPGHLLKPGLPADAVIHVEAEPQLAEADNRPTPPAASATTLPPAALRATRQNTPAAFVGATPTAASSPAITSLVLASTTREPRATVRPTATPSPVPPPGGRIVYSTRDENGVYQLWSRGLDGSGPHPIAADVHEADVRGDGLIVANGEGKPNRETLRTMKLDGSDAVAASLYANDLHPRWAPDGNRVLFINAEFKDMVIQEGTSPSARRLPVRYDITNLTADRAAWLDDSHVVYHGCDIWRGGSNCGLYAVDLGGANEPRRLTADVQATAPAVGAGGVAHMSLQDGHWHLFLLPPGKALVQLTGGAYDDVSPAWSQDGRWLAFVSNRSGQWAVWAMPADLSANAVKAFDLPESSTTDWANESLNWMP